MGLLTAKQYAKQHNVSVQSVYARIKRGTLQTTMVDNVAMIDATTDTTKQTTNTMPVDNDLNLIIKEVVKPYKQQIKLLKKQLDKCESYHDKEYDRLDNLFNKLYSNHQIEQIIDTTIDASTTKKKKKSKKKKKKSKS